jgi:cell division septation protein DedD
LGAESPVEEALFRQGKRYPIERMRQLEEERAESQAAADAEEERLANASAQRYAVQVATFLNEGDAIETLTTLVDGGYDGSLVSSESDGQIVFTIQIGPFPDLWEADRAAQTLDAAYGFESSVTILRGDAP